MNCEHQSRNEKYFKLTPELIDNMNEWIGNHPQVVNLPIIDDTLFVPDPEQPWKKIRVYKLLFADINL